MPTTPLSGRSSKAEIFKAYEEIKAKFEQKKEDEADSPQREVAKKREINILETTARYSPESLDNDLNNLSRKIQFNLNEIKEQLTGESCKLGEMRQAVDIKKKELEELYQIQVTADALKILITDYEVKQQELETSKKILELSLDEEIKNKKKNWEREQEEYLYALKTSRQKEINDYTLKRVKEQEEWQKNIDVKENELRARETKLEEQETELSSLKQTAAGFPDKLSAEVARAEAEKTRILTTEFNHEKQLSEQKWLAEKGIMEVQISNLQEIIKKQTEEASSLKNALAAANASAQSLAVTVIEGASGLKQIKELEKIAKGEKDGEERK